MSNEQRQRIVILGGGGHGQVVAEAAMAAYDVAGFLDDDPGAEMPVLGLARLGDMASYDPDVWPGFTPGIGDNELRRRMMDEALRRGGAGAVVVHPGASVSRSARMEAGVFVGPGAVVHTAARIGAGTIINSGAIVEHDVMLGRCVHIAPGAALGGNVHVGDGALIGLGARVLPGIRIGAGATVGAGAVVIRDVVDGATVIGVPAG
jgi:UDP-perosamine 4-acetyltransferase